MRTLKLTTMAAIMACMSTAAFAVNPKTTDSKSDAKAVSKTVNADDSKTKDDLTYFVTGSVTIDGEDFYTITTTDPGCTTGTNPCEVLSNQEQSNGRIPQSAVDQVVSTRP